MSNPDLNLIVDFLHRGPKTVPEIVDRFDVEKVGQKSITMSERKVYRLCKELETHDDDVLVGLIEPEEQRVRKPPTERKSKNPVRFLFLRSDVGMVLKGVYGRVFLPVDFMQNEINEHRSVHGGDTLDIYSVLSEPKTWRAKAYEENRSGQRSLRRHLKTVGFTFKSKRRRREEQPIRRNHRDGSLGSGDDQGI